MTPYLQLVQLPDGNVKGDCFRTCIACLLDIHPEKVPLFIGDETAIDPGGDQLNQACDWLIENHGLSIARIFWDGAMLDKDDVLNLCSETIRGHHYLLSGQSSNGLNHCVICRGNKIVHDPKPDAGIVGPLDGGYWCVEVITKVL